MVATSRRFCNAVRPSKSMCLTPVPANSVARRATHSVRAFSGLVISTTPLGDHGVHLSRNAALKQKNLCPRKDTGSNVYFLVALASALPNTPVTRVVPTDRAVSDEAGPPADPPPPAPPGRRRVTRKDRAEIVRLYESGLSALAVAEQAGVSKTSVLNVLKSEGVTVRPWGSRGWSRG